MDDKTYRRMFSPGGCQCGKTFRSYGAEAYHRHNFPLLCRPAKKPRQNASATSTDTAASYRHEHTLKFLREMEMAEVAREKARKAERDEIKALERAAKAKIKAAAKAIAKG
jgi:hypothetical protein